MDKAWVRFVVLGIIIMLVVMAWDLFLTFSGSKNFQEYTVTEISPNLYGNTEKFLRADANFPEFEALAAKEKTEAGN